MIVKREYAAMNFKFNWISVFKILTLLVSAVMQAACSTMPNNLREAPEQSPLVSDVQAEPSAYLTDAVLWGGSIVEVSHANCETTIQVVSRPLSTNSRPVGKDQTHGRFLAVIEGFLEPEIYKEKRLLTVLGSIESVGADKIGELDYVFPVVRVREHHLWQIETHSAYPYSRRGSPWTFWNSPYPYFYYDDFYWHHQHRPIRYPKQ